MKNAVTTFENKMNGIVGKPGGFLAPPSTEATLSRVNGDVATLYGEVDRADAAPTVAETNATTETERNFADVMRGWNTLKSADLPALNRQLRNAGLPEIQLRTTPAAETGED